MYKIYSLIDPRNNEIKYIGRTSTSLERRLSSHLSDPKRKEKYEWCQYLLKNNLKPIIRLETECTSLLESKEIEYNLTLYYINQGFKLFNKKIGEYWTQEEKYKRKLYYNCILEPYYYKKGNIPWNKGINQTDEIKLKISNTLKGRSLLEDTKRKISISLKGRIIPESRGQNISIAKKNTGCGKDNSRIRTMFKKYNLNIKEQEYYLSLSKSKRPAYIKIFKNKFKKEEL